MEVSKSSVRIAFIMLTSLFFMWGFVHNLDPILIPHLKKSFSLTTLQASLVDSSVFIAYGIMAIPAGILLKKYGYKAGIIAGLVCFAFGSFLFIPAANTGEYIFFLGALFVIGCGLALLETAANPYAARLGDPETASQRLNFAQAFNGLAVTIAPIVGAKLILTSDTPDEIINAMDAVSRQAALASEAASVKTPYTVIGIVILVIALLFTLIRMPDIREKGDSRVTKQEILESFQIPHLRWAVVTQFFYVGAQVCVNSLFILYAAKSAQIDRATAATYLGLGYGISFMVGRFIGTFFMQFIKPATLLTFYALCNIFLCLLAVYAKGMPALYIVFGISFFMSIMFPTIFSLGIQSLGKHTEMGSSLIVMAIVGGGILPLLFGYITDITGNIQFGYFVPLICFVVVAFFGWKGHRVVQNHVV
ncbi:MAG: L-fucose:H+ symporter permease [Chitinophagia bacterium]|nr:L-fucose:H+ symporter permease [Chitinophagia bacterium]